MSNREAAAPSERPLPKRYALNPDNGLMYESERGPWVRYEAIAASAPQAVPVAAHPAASGVDALWVKKAMELADEIAGHAALSADFAAEGFLILGKQEHLAEKSARESLRAHLSTALTGAAKEVKHG